MSWKNDGHGYVFKPHEVKFYLPSHSWSMKLSRILYDTNRSISIITYNLDCSPYIINLLGIRPNNISIICHSKFEECARKIRTNYPGIKISVNDSVHSKICLIEPDTIYLGSSNFSGYATKWHEVTVGLRNKDAYDWYLQKSFIPLWKCSRPLVIDGEQAALQTTDNIDDTDDPRFLNKLSNNGVGIGYTIPSTSEYKTMKQILDATRHLVSTDKVEPEVTGSASVN